MLLLASFVRRRVWSAPVGAAVLAAFAMGDVLGYRVNVSRAGNVGQGQMRMERPVLERGTLTWRLVFVMQAQRGPIKAIDRTTSWVDPTTFATTRFEKTEKHPLSRPRDRWNRRGLQHLDAEHRGVASAGDALATGRALVHVLPAQPPGRSARSRFLGTSTRRAIRRSCTCAVKNWWTRRRASSARRRPSQKILPPAALRKGKHDTSRDGSPQTTRIALIVGAPSPQRVYRYRHAAQRRAFITLEDSRCASSVCLSR